MSVRQIKPIPIFTDNDVPESVGRAFAAAGHTVMRLRDCMAPNSPDQIVEAACREGGMVLVTHNYKDFRRIAREQGGLSKRQANELCRIELVCSQVTSARRVQEEMDFIALGWARFIADPSAAMCITIAESSVRFMRGPAITAAAGRQPLAAGGSGA